MKTSREQIMEYMRANRAVSAADLSRALQMTEANARHHLKILSGLGLVIIIGSQPREGKGRPVQVFGLSELAIGSQLDKLTSALLSVMLVGSSTIESDQKLEKLAGELIKDKTINASPESDQPGASSPRYLNPTHRLVHAVRVLNDHHYEARWEAHALAPRLILGRCPYASIIEEHPELCHMDRHVIEQLTGRVPDQTAKRQPDRRGVRQCVFVLNQASNQKRKSND